MFIRNGKIKILFKAQTFYLFTSLIFCLLESGLLCVSTTASDLSDGQIASAQVGRALCSQFCAGYVCSLPQSRPNTERRNNLFSFLC